MLSLLVFVLLITLLFSVISENTSSICKIITDWLSPSSLDAEKKLELKILRDDLSKISMVNEFAKYARLERRVNKLDDEIRSSSKSRNELFLKSKFVTTIGYHVLRIAIFLTLLFKYRSEALLQLPPDWVYPFGFFIAFPSSISGGVGITLWMITCQSVVSKVTPMLFRQKTVR